MCGRLEVWCRSIGAVNRSTMWEWSVELCLLADHEESNPEHTNGLRVLGPGNV
ncbi:hypothetical protein SERLA73DRAFT_134277, partial [Serpula lacrymans var. lacrymans S7.3]